MTESKPPTDDYTIVSQEPVRPVCGDYYSDSLRCLLRDRIDRDGRPLAEIALLANMSRPQTLTTCRSQATHRHSRH